MSCPKTATSTSLCASLRPSMAFEDFWTAHPTWFYSTSREHLFRDGLSNSTKVCPALHQLHRTHKLLAGCTKVFNSSGCGVGPSENVRSHGWRSRSATGAQPSAYEAKLHATAERPQSVIAGRTPQGGRKERFSEGPTPHPRPQATGQAPNNEHKN